MTGAIERPPGGEWDASGPMYKGEIMPPQPGFHWVRPPDRDGVSQGWQQVPIRYRTHGDAVADGYFRHQTTRPRNTIDEWRNRQVPINSIIQHLTNSINRPADTAQPTPTPVSRFRNKWRRKNNTRII